MTSALENVKPIEVAEWLTLATAPSSTKLKTGETPYAFNTWVDEKPGSVITANGYVKVGNLPSGNPGTFSINYFKTSAGTQTYVVSDNATVWTTVDFQSFTAIITGLSSAFQLRGAVIRDKLWLTNGNDAVRTYDGSSVVVLDGSGGTPNVPKSRYIAYHDERVWLYHQSSTRSLCYFSALTDSGGSIIAPDNASAWPSSNSLQISEGDADFGTGLLLYRGYLHFFKQYSIWRLVGYDEYTYTRVKTRASTGTRFNESVQILDSLVHLIGIDGIYVFDGEETDRISDIIDPATAEQTSFGFNQLQQPNTNNLFWEVTATADFNAGTVPRNLSINNAATLIPTDNTQAAFQAAATLTNIDTTTTPNSIQLTKALAGASSVNLALGKTAVVENSNGGTFGNPGQLTDGVLSGQQIGLNAAQNTTLFDWKVDLGSAQNVAGFTVNQLGCFVPVDQAGFSSLNSFSVQYSADNTNWTTIAVITPNALITNPDGSQTVPSADYATTFSPTTARYWRLFSNNLLGSYYVSELQVFATAYNTTGQIVSQTLDLGDTPVSLGNFLSDFVLNGEGLTFQTQTSPDGVTWDAAIAVTNGQAIASTPRRYLRWIGNFTSDGNNTPVLSDAWVGTLYESAIHDTGGNIFAWGAFEADYTLNGQSITFYYRGATTIGGVSGTAWNVIVPGGAINISTLARYIQFKFEISGRTVGNNAPVVNSVTINWVVGSATQVNTLQNVASYPWRNRYWLSAAGAGSGVNNTILIRGKKTFGSPWQLKDWNILTFTRYLDNLYGTSSLDGSIFLLDTGFSKNGGALNSVFETGDFTFKGFQSLVTEMMVEVQRLGPYTLFVGTSLDMGQTWTDHAVDLTLGTGAPLTYWKRLNNLNLTTDKLRVRFFTNNPDQPWQVHNLIIYYQPLNQRGSLK